MHGVSDNGRYKFLRYLREKIWRLAFVCKAAGVGKKSAERVIVDLRDKVGIPSRYGATEVKGGQVGISESDEALDALIALGFPLKEATAALEKVPKDLSVEERVRMALKQ